MLAQTIAQVTQGWPDADEWAADYRLQVASGEFGGYQILTDFHELPEDGEWHGFVAVSDRQAETNEETDAEYAELLELWTQVILSKRLSAYQNDRALVSA